MEIKRDSYLEQLKIRKESLRNNKCPEEKNSQHYMSVENSFR